LKTEVLGLGAATKDRGEQGKEGREVVTGEIDKTLNKKKGDEMSFIDSNESLNKVTKGAGEY